MLISKLWNGMRTDLKSICGYKFEHRDIGFDKLRLELRQLEIDHKCGETVKTRMNVQVESDLKKDSEDLKGQLSSMASNVSSLTEQLKVQSSVLYSQMPAEMPKYGYGNSRPWGRSQEGRTYGNQGERGRGRGRYGNRRRRFNNRGNAPQNQGDRNTQGHGNAEGVGNEQGKFKQGIVCWNCNQEGHYQYDCTLRDDFLNPTGSS